MSKKRGLHVLIISWVAFLSIVCILAATRPTNQVDQAFEKRLQKAIHNLIGIRYRWGGTTHRGVDCSGAVYYLWKIAGKPIPRMTARKMHAIYGGNYHYSKSQKFDLIWWTTSPRRPYGHIGIMDGDQTHFWHASPRKGFTYAKIKKPYYWHRFFADCGRIE